MTVKFAVIMTVLAFYVISTQIGLPFPSAFRAESFEDKYGLDFQYITSREATIVNGRRLIIGAMSAVMAVVVLYVWKPHWIKSALWLVKAVGAIGVGIWVICVVLVKTTWGKNYGIIAHKLHNAPNDRELVEDMAQASLLAAEYENFMRSYVASGHLLCLALFIYAVYFFVR